MWREILIHSTLTEKSVDRRYSNLEGERKIDKESAGSDQTFPDSPSVKRFRTRKLTRYGPTFNDQGANDASLSNFRLESFQSPFPLDFPLNLSAGRLSM